VPNGSGNACTGNYVSNRMVNGLYRAGAGDQSNLGGNITAARQCKTAASQQKNGHLLRRNDPNSESPSISTPPTPPVQHTKLSPFSTGPSLSPGEALDAPSPLPRRLSPVHEERVQEAVVHLAVDPVIICESGGDSNKGGRQGRGRRARGQNCASAMVSRYRGLNSSGCLPLVLCPLPKGVLPRRSMVPRCTALRKTWVLRTHPDSSA